MAEVVALLAERREEIKAIEKLYRELSLTLGEEAACHVLCEAIAAEARGSGRAAAPKDPEEAGLDHFADVFFRRGVDGGMDHGTRLIEGRNLYLDVARCDYHALYTSSELPYAIAYALSCGREEPFANGYDSRLKLKSLTPPTKEERSCRMVFYWDSLGAVKKPDQKITMRVKNT